jgi:aspartate/methionine/tyrosine aminotransferase
LLSARVRGLSTSATGKIRERAASLVEDGADVISLAAGELARPTPTHIVEAAVRAGREPRAHRYPPIAGTTPLREAIARDAVRRGIQRTEQEILVTNGAKQAAFNAMLALVDPGDEVLIPTPVWGSYPAMVAAAGGTVRFVDSTHASFLVDVDALELRWTPRAKLLVLISPGNPTGALYDRKALERVANWASHRNVWILFDEVYRQLTFVPGDFTSLAECTDIAERCVVVDSVSKAYAMTGWRVGWLAGPRSVVEAATRLQSHSTSGVSAVSQAAAVAALTGPQDVTADLRAQLQQRAEVVSAFLDRVPGVQCSAPSAGFYAFPSVKELLRPVENGGPTTTAQLVDTLLTTAKVSLVPGDVFHAPGYLRLSFSCDEGELTTALDRLHNALCDNSLT